MKLRSILFFLLLAGHLLAQRDDLPYLPSKLYDTGGYEIHLFNNYFTWSDGAPKTNYKYDFFTSNLQFLYGISTKLNVGLDVKLRSVSQTSGTDIPAFEALQWKNTGKYDDGLTKGYRRSGVTALGLRWKIAPFENVPNFSIQQTVYIPLGKELEGSATNGFIDWGGYSFFTQLYYDHSVTSKVSLFVESDLIIENIGKAMFGQEDGYYQMSTPVSVILSYFPNPLHTFYGLINVAPQWGTTVKADPLMRTPAYTPFNQYGVGYKYAITRRILAEVIWTRFFNPSAQARIYTYNFGIRYFVNG